MTELVFYSNKSGSKLELSNFIVKTKKFQFQLKYKT